MSVLNSLACSIWPWLLTLLVSLSIYLSFFLCQSHSLPLSISLASASLGNLATREEHKIPIVEMGALTPLVQLLLSTNTDVATNASGMYVCMYACMYIYVRMVEGESDGVGGFVWKVAVCLWLGAIGFIRVHSVTIRYTTRYTTRYTKT